MTQRHVTAEALRLAKADVVKLLRRDGYEVRCFTSKVVAKVARELLKQSPGYRLKAVRSLKRRATR